MRPLLLAAAGVGALLVAKSAKQSVRHFEWAGKVVLITGASRGLGLVIARQLAKAGAQLAICGRDQATLEEARAELNAFAVPCDVRVKAEVEDMIRRVIENYGVIDVLINNAGTIGVGPQQSMTDADFEDALKIHFWGPYFTSMAVLPHMRSRKQGRIVNITSIGARVSVPHMLPYSSGKFAGYAFSRGLRYEVRRDGVLVTTVVPGLMRTGSPRNADFKGNSPDEYAWFKIADSLPFLSIGAEEAATEILAATQRGDIELTLSGPAKLAVLADNLLPELSGELATIATALLPKGNGQTANKGRNVETKWSENVLTAPSDAAAAANNQL